MEATQNEKQGRGRPAKEEKKLTRSINLKLTENDFKAIRQRAESLGMKPTRYARQMVLTGKIKPRYTKEELALRRKIAGMANNTNQIARKANAEGFTNTAFTFLELHRDLKKLLDDSEK